MKKLALGSFGAIVLCFAIGIILARGQDSNQVQQQNAPTVFKVVPYDANSSVRPRPEPNAGGPAAEELRKQSRERIIQRVNERREMMARHRTGTDQSLDVNALKRTRGRLRSRDVNMPLERPVAEANQNQERLSAIEQQISTEEAKHRERLARLNRIHEVAQQQGDTEAVARVDKLLQEEQRRFDMIQARIEHRKNRIAEFSKKAATEKVGKKIGEGNDINRPPAENK